MIALGKSRWLTFAGFVMAASASFAIAPAVADEMPRPGLDPALSDAPSKASILSSDFWPAGHIDPSDPVAKGQAAPERMPMPLPMSPNRSDAPDGAGSALGPALISPAGMPLPVRDFLATGRSPGPNPKPSATAPPPEQAINARPPAGADKLPTANSGALVEPELPPDISDRPPVITQQAAPGPTAPQAPAASAARDPAGIEEAPSPDSPRSSAPATGAPGLTADPPGVSRTDIEAAVAAMIGREVKARPIGAGDWAAARQAIGAFYAARDFAPLWIGADGLSLAARAAIVQLSAAADDGLDLAAFALPDLAGGQRTPAQYAADETALSQAIVAYAIQASGGRIAASRMSPLVSTRPSVVDPANALALVASARDPAAALKAFNPPQKGYRELRQRLAQLRAANAVASRTRFPPGPTLRIGMIDPRVALIRTRFGLEAAAPSVSALVYDSQVASAIAQFQRANGLSPSGALTPVTALALSGGAAARQEAIVQANMEMWRWEPREMGESRVEVNVPDFSLKVMNGDTVLHRARVIVGKPETPTPIFSNAVRYLLVNPSWHVPESIIRKEMMPKLAKDPDYLTRMGFDVTQNGDQLVVRQPPGERNALGRLLFMFPNDHSVYLHDTPARGLFDAGWRALSHGCVRVDQPMRLGEILMGGAAAGWTQERLRGLIGRSEQTLFLPRPTPIHIEYFTAFVDENGVLQLRDDLYGLMRRVEDALGLESQG